MPWLYLQISWSYHHFISMVLIPVYACKCQTFLKYCSCRIMPVAAKWVNFDFLVRCFFHKWIVLECNSKCFTLWILPFSKCSGNSVIFESCFQSSALYLFILKIIFLVLAQIFPMVSAFWLLMIYLFHLDWFLLTIISKRLMLWQPQVFLHEQLYFSLCFYIMGINLLKLSWEVCGPAVSEDPLKVSFCLFSWSGGSVTCSCSCGRFQAWRDLRES